MTGMVRRHAGSRRFAALSALLLCGAALVFPSAGEAAPQTTNVALSCVLAPGVLNVSGTMNVTLTSNPTAVDPGSSFTTSASMTVTTPASWSTSFASIGAVSELGSFSQVVVDATGATPAVSNWASQSPGFGPITLVSGQPTTLTTTLAGGPYTVTGAAGGQVAFSLDAGQNLVFSATGDDSSGTPVVGPLAIDCTTPATVFETVPINATGPQPGDVAPYPVLAPAPDVLTSPGKTATFTDYARGTPSPTAQWQVSTDGGKTWVNDTTDSAVTTTDGAQIATTLTISPTTLAESGNRYRPVWSNRAGTVNGPSVLLAVNADGASPVITVNPTNVTTCVGASSFAFTAAAIGNPNPALSWQVSTDGGATWSNAGANAFNTPTAAENGYQYRAVFTNAAGSTTSAPATLTVGPGPAIATQPTSATVTAPAAATFTATPGACFTGANVQWYVTARGSTTSVPDTADASAMSDTLTVSPTDASESGNVYQALFFTNSGLVYSNPVSLTVNAPTAPTVTGVSPGTGGGFTLVLIRGTNLSRASVVSFGTKRALFLPVSAKLIIALAPPQASGTAVDVTVTTQDRHERDVERRPVHLPLVEGTSTYARTAPVGENAVRSDVGGVCCRGDDVGARAGGLRGRRAGTRLLPTGLRAGPGRPERAWDGDRDARWQRARRSLAR